MAARRKTGETNGTVRFVLDGEVMALDNVDPTRTVLNFLREDLGRTGTKEGCAEGDCGACTVVLGELDGHGVRFRAVNACIQFVPTLDGKELITVESLKRADGALHPVQRAMIDCHGSQCGFCTPGFVMSLFALYKSADHPSRIDINDAIAGNLCRCTGYRPIVEAAERMQIAVNDTHTEIGAAATLTDAFAELVHHYPELDELFRRFASPPIRNAGTLGGNIANGSPIGDSMPALMALDTSLVLRKGS